MKYMKYEYTVKPIHVSRDFETRKVSELRDFPETKFPVIGKIFETLDKKIETLEVIGKNVEKSR